MHSDTAPASFRPSASPHPGDHEATAPRMDEAIPVVLFEDVAGRLVVVDARRGGAGDDAGPLLPIGRARIVLRHLAAPVTTRLLSEGRVVVDGADGLNVLLAFAHELGRDFG